MHKHIALSLLTATLLFAGQVAAQSNWVGYTYVPSGTLTSYKGMDKFAADVGRITGNAVNAKMNVGGSLPVKVDTITQAVGEGIVQFAADGQMIGSIPVAGVMRLPMLFTTEAEFAQAAAVVLPYVERAYAQRGATVLAGYMYPLQVGFSSKKFAAPEDFKGLKMRVTSPEQGEFVRRMGGIPVTIGGPEVPSALAGGTVDGVFTATSTGGRLWKDSLKSSYRLGPNFFHSYIIVNTDAFNKLTPTQRDQIRVAARQTADEITAGMRGEEGEAIKQMQASGMVVTDASAAQFAASTAAMASYWDDWSKGKDAATREALEKARAQLKR